ncbi:ubiquitin-like domain-containing protein CIP73 isoform X3 [Helianthus annuus]|uniref:ubiquitin-like domain-containing protein CIP73 isoform X3 n=1 Tax=Helianthus annuus TaxID=4232 RepID=UPI000B8F74AF|nr:ubiquitin-like domain-containing protein CIP73 isoform X3 [Helianthus annuus]
MADEHAGTSNVAGESSELVVDIHIKTLDSQVYDFRVDKNILVSSFKEKIASDVGLPVGLQRLIFRGKVLKDEHRLSEYHVESGHTLHLVARQSSESQPSTGTTANGSNTGQDANAAGSRPRIAHISHSVVLGTFGGGDPNLGGPHDISRVISAVLDSFGVRDGSPPVPPPNMQPIPDSLHTLSVFMNHMEQALSQNGYQPSNGAERTPTIELPSSARGVPLPAALAVVMRHAQRLLSGPAIDSLSRTAGRLEGEESCTDPTVRAQIQSEAMQSGLAMQHLGALLLELGRTTLTLRIGQSPAESSVRAGPAVYISPSGPNPIMVQPFPLQTNSLFRGNATPMNSTGFGPVGFGPVGIGAVPRHVNVHIHAGIGQRGTANEGERANGATTGVNLQTRRVDDSTRTENQRRGQQAKPEASSSSVPPVNAPGDQVDPAAIMNQVIESPALDGLLSGVSNQTGIGSPDALRNMLGQLTQNPAMMNVVNQIAQQIDDDQDMSNMFASMGGPSGGGGDDGGFDLSSMIQQMMPVVAQAFGGDSSGSGSGSNMFQQPPSMDRELQPTSVNDIPSDPQVNLEDSVDKIEHDESSEEVLSSVIKAAARMDDNGGNADELSEICSDEGLANEFMDMLKRDVSRRVEEEGE